MNKTVAQKHLKSPAVVMSHDKYLAHPAINQSSLKILLNESPLHFQHSLKNPRPQSDAQAFGNMVHTALESLDLFKSTHVLGEKFDRRTKEGKAAAAEFEAKHAGKTVVDPEQWDAVLMIHKSVMSHPVARAFVSAGVAEQSFFWRDPVYQVDLKARVDLWLPKFRSILDIKTTRSVRHFSFQRDALNFGYDFQAAFYMAGVEAVTGEKQEAFRIIAIENKAPYDVVVYNLDDAVIELGQRKVRQALALYAECEAKDSWPGTSSEIVELGMPSYAFNFEGGEE